MRNWTLLSLLVVASFVQAQSVSDSILADFQDWPTPSTAEANSVLGESALPLLVTEESKSNQKDQFYYSNPGPWGKLRYTHMYLEPPTDMVDALPLPHSKIRWTFRVSDATTLAALFEKAGLPYDMQLRLADPANQSVVADELNIFPSLEDVEAMTPAMREVIYPVLATSSTGQFYTFPILMTTKEVGEWFGSSKIRPELVEKIRSMSYARGSAIGFSDVNALMNYVLSESEARTIFKSLLRTRTLMVKIELTEDQDVESLIDYWTSGVLQRRKDNEPIIRSVFETQGLNQLELSHLLPPIPRKLLYTYPGSNYSFNGTLPDCHWTALNFFHHEPHEFLLDARFVSGFVEEKCIPVQPPYLFGDFIFMIDPKSGGILHSCVYLADDIVFTKNGRNAISPWVVMKIADVTSLYLQDPSLIFQFFRLKKP